MSQVYVTWNSHGRLDGDANGDVLANPGDEGVLDRERAEALKALNYCTIDGEVEDQDFALVETEDTDESG